MSSFKLSLPTDIPWRRICVSEDMMDPMSCDDQLPPRWHSSLAAFRYDPPEEYQPYDNEAISYIKVVATITPFGDTWLDPTLTSTMGDFGLGIVEAGPFIDQILGPPMPCYGAVLQVTVAPTKADRENFALDRYPYFIECEPKKRELFETVSDTGEVLSGSSSSLSVGKSATNAYNQESLNVDLGGSFSWATSISYMGASQSGSLAGDDRQQVGTIHRTTSEDANVRQATMSAERRELQSHTTQLTQMYNLFQAFHLGTNRAVFLLEPRPHIRQTEAGFFNGPRKLEGMQEIFLVLVRPKSMNNFCISAVLETLHATTTPADPDEDPPQTQMKTVIWPIRWGIPAGVGEESVPGTHEPRSATYPLDPGWEIVNFTPKELPGNHKGYGMNFAPPQSFFDGAHSSQTLEANGFVEQWVFDTDDVEPGDIEAHSSRYWFDVEVSLRKIAPETEREPIPAETEYVRKLWLSARELCCCPPERGVKQGWITWVGDVNRPRHRMYSGPASPQRFVESRRMAAMFRDEMMRGFSSWRRYERGEVEYLESDAFYTRLVGLLKASRASDRLRRPLAEAPDLDDSMRGRLYRAFGHATVGEILNADEAVVARVLGVGRAEVRQAKRTLLQGIAGPVTPDRDRRVSLGRREET